MGSKAPKQRPSAQDIQTAKVAVAKNARFNEAFAVLEQQAVDELQTANADKQSDMVAGRQNADLEAEASSVKMQAEQGMSASGTSPSGGIAVDSGMRRSAAVQDGRLALQVGADETGRDSIDQDRLNVIKTGQDVARGAQSSLTHSARLQNSKNATSLRANQMVDQARMSAIGEFAGAALAGGYIAHDKATATHSGGKRDGQYINQTNDLNWAQKGLRRWSER